MDEMRVLVVEDERKVASFIRQGLAEEGYTVAVDPHETDRLVHRAPAGDPRADRRALVPRARLDARPGRGRLPGHRGPGHPGCGLLHVGRGARRRRRVGAPGSPGPGDPRQVLPVPGPARAAGSPRRLASPAIAPAVVQGAAERGARKAHVRDGVAGSGRAGAPAHPSRAGRRRAVRDHPGRSLAAASPGGARPVPASPSRAGAGGRGLGGGRRRRHRAGRAGSGQRHVAAGAPDHGREPLMGPC